MKNKTRSISSIKTDIAVCTLEKVNSSMVKAKEISKKILELEKELAEAKRGL